MSSSRKTRIPRSQLNIDLIRDYKITFNSEHGARVLEDLVEFVGADKHCFDKDPIQTAFNLGQRNVILRIRELLNMVL